ncbi:bifunctional glycosyltransferase/CDP-glycerol:glycerophosphate glycerophosphotransferase [Spirillospora albida]|uniref:bifunctional glycosyltransferase/CDP-glycerol:glycerophosphate glycerophosphotransferase n=1 Tax=Spirillospora albida TaxID=58123 RepID=UPI0004C1DCBA|nr:CDP-glycerol glycerophosphotransferase family protein [Spirillospora albida]
MSISARPALSVIVPFYDVECYFDECLASLAAQTFADIEVICVDDGSRDGSAAIAERYAARDPRFRIVRQDNQGLGPARNTGVDHARGRYLTFVDSDDVIPPGAYGRLVGALEESGSDLVCGHMARLSSAGVVKVAWVDAVFAAERTGITVADLPVLLRERSPVNKVYRREFWDAHGLRFPAGYYEDAPVIIPALLLAGAIDVVPDVVYHWRRRERGPLSITERSRETAQATDLLHALIRTRAFVVEHRPELLEAFDLQALEREVWAAVCALAQADEDDQKELLKLIGDVMSPIDERLIARLPVAHRVQIGLAARGAVDEIVEMRRAQLSGDWTIEPVRRGLWNHRWYARHPLWEESPERLPRRFFDITGALSARTALTAAEWDGDVLRAEALAYIRLLDTPRRDDSQIRLTLRRPGGGVARTVPIERLHRPSATAVASEPHANHDWAAFAFTLDAASLLEGGRRRRWVLEVEVAAHGVRRRARLDPRRIPALVTRDGDGFRFLRAARGGDGSMQLVSRPLDVVCTRATVRDGRIELGGSLAADFAGKLVIRAVPDGPHGTVEAAADVTDGAFTVRLPLPSLDGAREARWRFSTVVAGKTHRLIGLDVPEGDPEGGAVKTAFRVGRGGGLDLYMQDGLPVLEAVTWTEEGVLRLTGRQDRPGRFVLRRGGCLERPVDTEWDGRRFTASVDPSAGNLPMPNGDWELLFADDTDARADVAFGTALTGGLPESRRSGLREVEVRAVTGRMSGLRIRIVAAHDEAERGAYAQRSMRRACFTPRTPTEPLAVFVARQGLGHGGHPEALLRELRRRRPDLTPVWLTADGRHTAAVAAESVVLSSQAGYEALSRARLVISDHHLFEWFEKRPGQCYVQTWHGTPMKRVGFDLEDMPFHRVRPFRAIAADVARWDLLLSGSPYMTDVMRSGFRYEGPVAECGSARNDVLVSRAADDIAARTRHALGIPDGKKVVLYAPTGRNEDPDATFHRAFQPELDVEVARRELGDDHVLLIRAPQFTARRYIRKVDGFTWDVTDYPYIEDLYQAADVLVTDYSSAMADFVITGRPVFLLGPDHEMFHERLRGLVVDLKSEGPGPLLRTTRELAEALRGPNPALDGRYARFRAMVSPGDDGKASQRAVDAILEHLE